MMNTVQTFDNELGHDCIMRFLALRACGMIGPLFPLNGTYYLEVEGMLEQFNVDGMRRRINYWFPHTDYEYHQVQRKSMGRETLSTSYARRLHFR